MLQITPTKLPLVFILGVFSTWLSGQSASSAEGGAASTGSIVTSTEAFFEGTVYEPAVESLIGGEVSKGVDELGSALGSAFGGNPACFELATKNLSCVMKKSCTQATPQCCTQIRSEMKNCFSCEKFDPLSCKLPKKEEIRNILLQKDMACNGMNRFLDSVKSWSCHCGPCLEATLKSHSVAEVADIGSLTKSISKKISEAFIGSLTKLKKRSKCPGSLFCFEGKLDLPDPVIFDRITGFKFKGGLCDCYPPELSGFNVDFQIGGKACFSDDLKSCSTTPKTEEVTAWLDNRAFKFNNDCSLKNVTETFQGQLRLPFLADMEIVNEGNSVNTGMLLEFLLPFEMDAVIVYSVDPCKNIGILAGSTEQPKVKANVFTKFRSYRPRDRKYDIERPSILPIRAQIDSNKPKMYKRFLYTFLHYLEKDLLEEVVKGSLASCWYRYTRQIKNFQCELGVGIDSNKFTCNWGELINTDIMKQCSMDSVLKNYASKLPKRIKQAIIRHLPDRLY